MYTYNLIFSQRLARRGNAHTLENPMKLFWRGRKIKVDGCISSQRWCSSGYSASVNYRAKPYIFCLETSKTPVMPIRMLHARGFRSDTAVKD